MKIPKWLEGPFSQAYCPQDGCERKLQKDGVIGVGLREDIPPGHFETILSFFYEYKCPHCGVRSVFSGFPTTIEDFIVDMMELGGFEPENNREAKNKKSQISNAEVNEAKKIINSSKNFEELMENIGINRELIEWYRHKPGNDENR